MAENRIEILVTSKNDTKAGFDQAKKDAEKAGDDAGKGFMSKFSSWLTGHQTKGLFGNDSAGGGIGGIFSTALSAGPLGIGGLGVALTEVTGLVSGFAAAGAGLGAFGLVAIPTLKNIQAGFTSVLNAADNYQNASQNLSTAINQSKADMQAYQATITGLEPDLQNAAKLLTDQNVVWQNLSPAQQASVLALRDNSAVYKNLLPDQKTALNALIAEETAWNDLTPAQQTAATSLQSLRLGYDQLSSALEPSVMTVFNDALKIANTLLPDLKPFAVAAGNSLDGLLQKVGTFFKSADFRKWLDTFDSLVGPALDAIGAGVGKLTIAFGKLLTVMPAADVVRTIAIAFGILTTAIQILTGTVQVILGPLRELAGLVSFLTGSGGNLQNISGAYVGSIPSGLGGGGLNALGGTLPVLVQPPPGIGPGGGKIGQLSAATPVVQLNVASGGSALDAMFVEWLKNAVRVRGGGGPKSVQIALGQTH